MAFDFIAVDHEKREAFASTYGKAGAGIVYHCFDGWGHYAGVSGNGESKLYTVDLFLQCLIDLEAFLNINQKARDVVYIQQHYAFIDDARNYIASNDVDTIGMVFA